MMRLWRVVGWLFEVFGKLVEGLGDVAEYLSQVVGCKREGYWRREERLYTLQRRRFTHMLSSILTYDERTSSLGMGSVIDVLACDFFTSRQQNARTLKTLKEHSSLSESLQNIKSMADEAV
jgi:hypothetical protein